MLKNVSLKYFFTLVVVLHLCLSPVVAQEAAGGTDFKKYLSNSVGVLIVAGIGTVYSGMLYKSAAEQEKESQENIKKIDKMIATFNDSYANQCTKGRDSLDEPKCYCYTADGKQNTARTNSQICKDLWAKDTYKLAGDATDYSQGVYNPDVAGCLTVTGEFDERCKCKKLVDSKGKNACQKTTNVSIPTEMANSGFATSTGLKDLLKWSANSANGSPGLNALDAGSLAQKAVNAKKFSEQMISKLDPKKNGNIPLISESNVGKYASAVLGEKNIVAGMNSRAMATDIAGSRSDNPAVESLLKQAQAKVGIELSGGKGLNAKAEKKKSAFSLNLGNEPPVQGGGVNVQDFSGEEKNYKYKNSDIASDNGASIFEIISNRYVQSGLKRLFGDE